MGDEPEILKKTHWDWPKPFRWIPRSWTAVQWGAPKKILGDQIRKRKPVGQEYWAPAPIGEPQSWQLSRYPEAPGILKYLPLYLAFTNKRGRHFRMGLRWDDVDSYSTWSIATRKFPISDTGDRDTSTI